MNTGSSANRWASACLVLALMPLAVFALLLLFEAIRHTSSQTLDEVFYASVPICGVAAVACGLVAWRRPGGRRWTIVGLVVGAAEMAASLLVLVGLSTAFDTLGAA